MAAGPPRVYLHVGLPKTGTTHIQEMLWHNRATAAAQGLLYPGYVHAAHFHAAVDLQRDRYPTWVTPLSNGAWDRLVAHVRRWPDRTVITNELLATAHGQHVERAMRDLAFAEVHVVCTARDLARQIPSVWQENVRNRHVESYSDFLAAIRRPDPNALGDLFWAYQDLTGVLAAWAEDMPPDRVHVITVPGPGAPAGLLWQRFADLVGVDPKSCVPPTIRVNRSLGAPQTELLRLINRAMPESVDWSVYDAVVKRYLAPEVLAVQGEEPRITLPPDELAWVRDRAELFASRITAAGYHVIGDLAELVPDDSPDIVGPATDVPTHDVLTAAVSALAELAGRLPADPSGRRVSEALRSFSERHPPVMALRRWYWQGKARFWARSGRPHVRDRPEPTD